ncbi:MAG TPA: hypothetical protein VEQ66_00185 [Propionibacteriaceae bacterium]|nr:hypothetical protein [Propionibacteriaceae bacterium]
MNSDAWLTGVVGVSGVVLIGLVLVVLRTLGQSRPARPGSSPSRSPRSTSVNHVARGMGYLFGAMNTPRRQRSVEDNLQRAFARIDAIDPHVAQRRIGMALADFGPVGADPPPETDRPARSTWPYDKQAEGRARRGDAQ